MQWPTVGEKSDDRFALDVLASILAGPRTARITKALVYDEQSAASVNIFQSTNEDVGDFLLMITPRPGHALTNLEAAADAIIERLKNDGPTAEEIQKATAGEELGFVRSLESNLGKAMRLSDGAGYHGDAGYFRTEYKKTLSVTAEDVKRVANKYLTRGRVVLSVVPTGKLDQAAKPDQSSASPNTTRRNRKVANERPHRSRSSRCRVLVHAPRRSRGSIAKKFRRRARRRVLRVPAWTKGTLANGADLIVSEKHDLPLVSFSITFLGGEDQFEPAGRAGGRVADGRAAERRDQDAQRRRAVERAAAARHDRDASNVGGESGTSASCRRPAKFRADARHPRRHAAQLDVSCGRPRAAARPAARRVDAGARAAGCDRQPRVSAHRLRLEHPYGRIVTEESLKAITRDDIVAFHKAYFQPGRALDHRRRRHDARRGEAGDREGARGVDQGWRAVRRSTTRRSPSRDATTIFLVDKPGAAQSTFAIGRPGPPRSTPDYYALQVMNTILGGMFQSRLNANIREEKGYSYGVNSGFGYGKGPGAVPCRRRHRHGEERRRTDRVHERASRHRRQPSGDRRRADDGEGRAGSASARRRLLR